MVFAIRLPYLKFAINRPSSVLSVIATLGTYHFRQLECGLGTGDGLPGTSRQKESDPSTCK